VQKLRLLFEVKAEMMAICNAVYDRGWVMRTFALQGDISDEDEKIGWKTGLSYKVVLMDASAA
jgi:hypothetical protein